MNLIHKCKCEFVPIVGKDSYILKGIKYQPSICGKCGRKGVVILNNFFGEIKKVKI